MGTSRALLGLCLLGGISFAAPSRLAFAAGPQKTVPVVLWVGGFAHDFDAFARILSRRLPERAAGIRVEVARNAAFLLRPQSQRPAVILMDHCYQSAQGVLDGQQKTNLLEWVRGGVGVVAVHASYYSFPEWKEVRELYGPRFIKHEKVDQYIAGKFVDRAHPITRGLPETFRLHSELYQSTPLPADCHLLAVARDEGRDRRASFYMDAKLWPRPRGDDFAGPLARRLQRPRVSAIDRQQRPVGRRTPA